MIEIEYRPFACTISGLTTSQLKSLRENFKYENDFRQRMITRATRGFSPPKYTYLMDMKGGFYTGFLHRVTNWLNTNGLTYKINKQEFNGLDVDSVKETVDKMKKLDPPITLRSYQKRAIYAACLEPRGIFYLATGLGKSLILATIAEALNRPTLIVCQTIDLARQLIEEIEFYTGNNDVGFIGDQTFKPRRVTVGILQSFSLSRKKADNKLKFVEYLKSVEAVIVDECHNAQSTSYNDLLSNLINCHVRYGMSATPFTSMVSLEGGGKGDFNILLHGLFGDYLYKMSTRDGINQGFLANPTVNIFKFNIHRTTDVILDFAYEYDKYIMNNHERNDLIARLASEAFNEGKRTVIFVTRIEHGNKIVERIVNHYGIDADQIAYVNGRLDKKDRKDLLLGFKSLDKNIIIGTVLNEGLNFQCDLGINAAAGESRRKAIQCLGRLLRKKRNESTNDVDCEVEENVVFVDLQDLNHPFFENHARTREKVYREEGHQVLYK